VIVTVDAPLAFLAIVFRHIPEAIIGQHLSSIYRVELEQAPPSPVDIRVSVPSGSGVLLSKDATLEGTTSLLIEDFTARFTQYFSIQGVSLGDDVPITIEILEANTSSPAGYDILPSTVDVDPSGISVANADYTTTTFSSNGNIQVRASVLYDGEDAAREGQFRENQVVRGGTNLIVPLISDAPGVVSLPDGTTGNITINAGSNADTIEADPLTSGIAAISIAALPAGFSIPINLDNEVIVTVDAPDTRLTTTSNSPHLSNIDIGDELQVMLVVRLEVAPPNPVDVTVEVIAPSVSLISTDATLAGSGLITFPDVTTGTAGAINIQGLSLNSATQIRISAPGYDDAITDVEIVNSGFRLTGNASNIDPGQTRNFTVSSVRLNPNNTVAAIQPVRGGASFDINVSSSAPGVGTVDSPVTLLGGDSSENTVFTALSTGATTISISQPPDFTEPAGATSIDMTVN
ncbi:MAG: hypothetical protein KAG66_03945, partial [Methylococcales bacterium]|nr:hypothetical protein [Methylococcales bacterium]